MAKELPYFKFEPAEWEAGNIQSVSRNSKGLFIEICSLYWIRLGELPYALALQKLCNGDASQMQELCDVEIICINEGQIIIEFLDEQLDEFQKTSEKRANAANKRWKGAKAMQMHSKSNAIREDKIIVDNKKEEKRKKFTPPKLQQVKDYFKDKGYTVESAEKAFNYYDIADWKDSKGNKVKNWKQKMLSVWMKEENKEAEKQPEKPKSERQIRYEQIQKEIAESGLPFNRQLS